AVIAVNVVGLKADARLAVAGRRTFWRRCQRDRCRLIAKAHLDPAVAVAKRHIDARLEAKLPDVELDGALLVGYRHDDRRYLVDPSLGAWHDVLLVGRGLLLAIRRP